MYVYDHYSDIDNYSEFKKELDEPYFITVMNRSEDFDMLIGNSTPKNFPCKFSNDSKTTMKINKTFRLHRERS